MLMLNCGVTAVRLTSIFLSLFVLIFLLKCKTCNSTAVGSKPIFIKLNDIKKENVSFAPVDIKPFSAVVGNYYLDMYKPNNSLEFETGQSNFQLVDVKSEFRNGFILAAMTAYNNHLPLELSPDDIWAEIALGVAQHLGGDQDLAETYRKLFVNHEGKKEIGIRIDHLGIKLKDPNPNNGEWAEIMKMFSDGVKGNTKTNMAEIMRAPFSTTGPVEQTVFHCLLMDTMKNFFEYKAFFLCGIPEVAIWGTAQDWQNILKRINELKALFKDFHWYLDRVASHVQKIVDSMSGRPDLQWWNTMMFEESFGSGGQSRLTGWLADFTPYLFRKNGERYKNTGSIDFDHLNAPAVTLTDFTLNFYGAEYKMKVASGFLGVAQNKETLAVRPTIGWMVYYVNEENVATVSTIGRMKRYTRVTCYTVVESGTATFNLHGFLTLGQSLYLYYNAQCNFW